MTFNAQLYTIHVTMESGSVFPAVYALLPSKSTECYTLMWETIFYEVRLLVDGPRQMGPLENLGVANWVPADWAPECVLTANPGPLITHIPLELLSPYTENRDPEL